MSNPQNPLVEVGAPLLRAKTADQHQGLNQGKDSLVGMLAATLRDGPKPYVLRVESQDDFNDIDSILLGLKLNPTMFEKFPDFNTWKINPLFGVDPANIQLLLKHHVFTLPLWLRESIDVSMRIMDVKAPGDKYNEYSPAIAIGFKNLAAHLALLALLEHSTHGRAIVYPDCSVQVIITSEINGFWVPVFISRVSQSHASNKKQMASLLSAARSEQSIALIVPGSVEEFHNILPTGPVVALGQRVGNKGLLKICEILIEESDENREDSRIDQTSWMRAMAA